MSGVRAQKGKRQNRGRVIVGKNVPIYWGDAEFISWEIVENWSLSTESGTIGEDKWFPQNFDRLL